ncbi:MAG TPA: ClbS/DfsB family four-helix bundle protein [Bellilinea sp.]|nr:ClbS/DfsB family four-helix bundle protein [Bellilinea sp.]
MPRPQTKTDLITQFDIQAAKLAKALDTLDVKWISKPGAVGEWAIKDLIGHLDAWHRMVLDWYEIGRGGGTPAVPAPGLKWSQLPELNQRIFEAYKDRSWDDIKGAFTESQRGVRELIDSINEEQLFLRGWYPWMNNNALASYLTSVGPSHYDWAIKEIKKATR